MFHRSRAGYYSIRGVDQHCALEILQGKGNNGNQAYSVVYAMYRRWQETGMRQAFVTPDAAQVCEQTECLESVQVTNLKPIFPAVFMNFPTCLRLPTPLGNIIGAMVVFDHQRTAGVFPAGTSFDEINRWIAQCIPPNIGMMFYFDRRGPIMVQAPYADVPIKRGFFTENIVKLKSDGPPSDGGIEAGTLHEYWPAAAVVTNFWLMLQQYPHYREQTREKMKVAGTIRYYDEYKIKLGAELKPQNLPLQPIRALNGEPTGVHMPRHWRKGHWRRQPHLKSESYKDKFVCGTFPDGREYHLILLPPVEVNA